MATTITEMNDNEVISTVLENFADLRLDSASTIQNGIDEILDGFKLRYVRIFYRRRLLRMLKSIVDKSSIWNYEPSPELYERCCNVFNSYKDNLLNSSIHIDANSKREIISLISDLKEYVVDALSPEARKKLSPPRLTSTSDVIASVIPDGVEYSVHYLSGHITKVYIGNEEVVQEMQDKINDILKHFNVRGRVVVTFEEGGSLYCDQKLECTFTSGDPISQYSPKEENYHESGTIGTFVSLYSSGDETKLGFITSKHERLG
jgi:hypothetical protein